MEDALTRIFAQLGMFAIFGGISVSQMEKLLRKSAVRAVAASAQIGSANATVSTISAITGLSRSAVTRVLKVRTRNESASLLKEKYTNRVLGAWHKDPAFLNSDGLPRTLPIFGEGSTFEALSRRYSSGIPVRAVLEELVRLSAVEVIQDRRVRAKLSFAVNQGIDRSTIRALGIRVEDLLRSLFHNIESNSVPRFSIAVESSIFVEKLPFIRREIERRGSEFASDVEDSILLGSINRKKEANSSKKRKCRAGVAIYYFEDSNRPDGSCFNLRPRKNLKRK